MESGLGSGQGWHEEGRGSRGEGHARVRCQALPCLIDSCLLQSSTIYSLVILPNNFTAILVLKFHNSKIESYRTVSEVDLELLKYP